MEIFNESDFTFEELHAFIKSQDPFNILVEEDKITLTNESFKLSLPNDFDYKEILKDLGYILESSLIEVLFYSADEEPLEISIQDNLESLQAIVGGYIEIVPFLDNMIIICNEDAIALDLPLNRMIESSHSDMNFTIRGNFIVASNKVLSSGEHEIDSLTPIQIYELKNSDCIKSIS